MIIDNIRFIFNGEIIRTASVGGYLPGKGEIVRLAYKKYKIVAIEWYDVVFGDFDPGDVDSFRYNVILEEIDADNN